MTSRYNAKNVEVKKYEKDYSEEGFWKKIKRHGIKIGAKPIYLTLLLFILYLKYPYWIKL